MIKNDPTNRRILLTAYNPCQLKESVLAPCHSIVVQFYVKENSEKIVHKINKRLKERINNNDIFQLILFHILF